jgi:hypothetical protein
MEVLAKKHVLPLMSMLYDDVSSKGITLLERAHDRGQEWGTTA